VFDMTSRPPPETGLANQGQENAGANFIELSVYRKAYDDLTRANSDTVGDMCDTDDDGDGLTDNDEIGGSACGPFTTPTSPNLADTDSDMVLDGAGVCHGIRADEPDKQAQRRTMHGCDAWR
jgi:hypothetical protein